MDAEVASPPPRPIVIRRKCPSLGGFESTKKRSNGIRYAGIGCADLAKLCIRRPVCEISQPVGGAGLIALHKQSPPRSPRPNRSRWSSTREGDHKQGVSMPQTILGACYRIRRSEPSGVPRPRWTHCTSLVREEVGWSATGPVVSSSPVLSAGHDVFSHELWE